MACIDGCECNLACPCECHKLIIAAAKMEESARLTPIRDENKSLELQNSDLLLLLQDYRSLLAEQPEDCDRPFILGCRDRLSLYDAKDFSKDTGIPAATLEQRMIEHHCGTEYAEGLMCPKCYGPKA